MSKPGIEEETFTIGFNGNWVQKNDILDFRSGNYKVLSHPKKVWYKYLFELLSLGFYKAPWEYIIKKDV